MSATIPQAKANALLQNALAALQQRRPSEALQAFDTLISQGVSNASIWLGKAYACRDLNDPAQMLTAVDQSLALEPRNPRAYILKATHYETSGDLPAASAFYLKALNVAPAPAQTPADLKPELERAQRQYTALTANFERHLQDSMAHAIAEAGEGARRVADSIDLMSGKKQSYFQQPKNYFIPELANIQFYDTSAFSWIAALEAATDDIRQELKAVIGQPMAFSAYVTGADNRPQSDPHGMLNNNDWQAFYLWKDGEIVPENAEQCPKTMTALATVPFAQIARRSPNILFSKLSPRSKIPPHHGLINTRLICHLPLIVPEGCGFRVGHTTKKWQEGKVWAFDDTIEHEAWNDSDENRYILLFEVWRPELSEVEQKLVSQLFEAISSY